MEILPPLGFGNSASSVRGAGSTNPNPQSDRERNLDNYRPAARAQEQVVPNAVRMDQLVDDALEAMANGYYWDRGSILNIAV